MRRVFLAVFLLVLAFIGSAFSQQRWERTYGGTGDDVGCSVQQTSDGGYIIVGVTASYGAGGNDVYLIKTDASGDTLWTKTYGGAGDDGGWCVQQTPDGGYIIGGLTSSFGQGAWDVWLIKTNASGDTLWTKTYGGPRADVGFSVQQTSDGGYIVVGYTQSYGAGNEDVYLIKTDASGDTLWTRTFGGNYYDRGYSVLQTSDGGYFIAGTTASFSQGDEDAFLIKTNATGDALWIRIYGGAGNDDAHSASETSEGGFIIVGYSSSFGAGPQDVYLMRMDSNGEPYWIRTYGGANYDFGYSVQQTSDGGYIIAGYTWSFGAGSADVYLLKISPSGDTLWTRTYGGANDDRGYSVQQTLDGGYIIAGFTNYTGQGTADLYLIKTDANGSSGVEENSGVRDQRSEVRLTATPNPFASFATVPGHSNQSFALYDISGRRVGTYKGDRIGEGLQAGVYFVRALEGKANLARIVKIR